MIQACTYHSAIIVKSQQWPTPSESIAIYCMRKLVSCVLHIFSPYSNRIFCQLVINMVWDLWKSYARTFRCLALLQWERTSGKGAMQAIVGSNFYCSPLNSESPLMCIVEKQRKDHTPWSLNYCFFTNQQGLFFAMPFLAHKGFALTGRLQTDKWKCLWSSAHCQVRMFMKQGWWPSANVFEAAEQMAPAVTCCWK